jgi:hypothetical protein
MIAGDGVWRSFVWWLSPIGSIGMGLGIVIGMTQLGTPIRKKTAAYRRRRLS